MFGTKHMSQWSARAIIERVVRETQQAPDDPHQTSEMVTVGNSVRGLWSCYADPGELTTTQAHTAMQLHLGCGVDTCHVRRRARTALVAAGHMILDPRAARAPETPRRSLATLLRTAVFGYGTMFFGGRHALR
ncbi:hypothetical protein LTV02_39145 [Nocardia yamanashiensis]|uniref:hypothetical protein n=1 Tax=Nocardia yamanashiensis TaxID=209247 RepID=UPI001E42F8E4|nr:hypothetical protein [Nocardia yamanashiensis]UGT41850.1 hypothetical protein LTV02_39145 [Nocardia yamanashiensis]